MKKRKILKAFSILAVFFCVSFFPSCMPGNPSEEEYSQIGVSGVLLSAGPAPSPKQSKSGAAAATPLAGYQLYCVTTTEPKIEGTGIADTAGNVIVIMKTRSASLRCLVLNREGARVASLIFSDASGTQEGRIISVVADVNLGQIGVNLDTGNALATVPANVTIVAPNNWLQVAPGAYHTCAIAHDHSLWCWGDNSAGQLGNGTNADVIFPTQVGTGMDWKQAAAAEFHTCALKTNGSLWCWGRNDHGALGDGTWDDKNIPTQVGTDTDWIHADFSCAIKNNGSLWCWGGNGWGELGDGTWDDKNIPTQVGTGTDWYQISTSGGGHPCAVKNNGSIWCWGRNAYGQVGDGTTVNKNIPTQVGSASDWEMVMGGGDHSCAVKTNGTVWCWGDNSVGQLGDGTNVSKKTPIQVGTGTGWGKITAGYWHTCVIKTNGSMWCWGGNYAGQIGNGTWGDKNIPIQVGAGTDWDQIASLDVHSCAIKTNGSLWCWGWNGEGELGDGTHTNKNYPVLVQ